MHNYNASKIWNCDKFGVQASHNGSAVMFANIRLKTMHSIILDEIQWLSILFCINTQNVSIPNFYVFNGKQYICNYIKRCELGSTMAM